MSRSRFLGLLVALSQPQIAKTSSTMEKISNAVFKSMG